MLTLDAGKKSPQEVTVIIEIPTASEPVKYEFNKDSGLLEVDRFMSTCMSYPANYGFIPGTLSEDGDPLDVLVVTPVPLRHGAVISARPVGMLKMQDESGIDAKILAVPVDKLTPLYRGVQEHTQLPELLIRQIEHFFERYKDLEQGKWVKVDGWANSAAARAEVVAGIERAKTQKSS